MSPVLERIDPRAVPENAAFDETERRILSLTFRHRRALVIAVHLLLVVLSYALAFMLRFDGLIPRTYAATFAVTLLPLLVFRLIAFAAFRLYTGWWRYVGMSDLFALLKAVGVSSVLFTASLVFTGHAYTFPRSVIVIDAILTVTLIGGSRFALRALRESHRPPASASRLRRVLIVGAGDAGELLLREMQNNPRLGFVPVGFVDDDPLKTGFHIHRVPVLGTSAAMGEILKVNPADEIIIAIPSASRTEIQAIVERCLQTRLPFKILPAIAALTGRVQISQVRAVQVEDLLGRDPVALDTTRVRADIAGRTVLITGGGGSIGSELARQIADYGPSRMVLLEWSENALYHVEQELRRTHPALELYPRICDVRDEADVARAFREHHPELVYHAAAFKHVPMMEAHLTHAVRNNVFGTWNVALHAAESGAKFVLISSDKAVSPSNVMGATKRLAELLVLSLNVGRTRHFVAVRFGNVLGSNGSVVPLFSEQIASGGPVTVTHPEATRYFMTIPEAVQLVLQASVLEEARDTVVMLEMGEPVRIVDLAHNLIRLSGLEPEVDVPIIFTGLRPGEKLHEQLTSDGEATMPTQIEKIRIVRTESPPSMEHALEQLRAALETHDERAVLRKLQELVPEFSPQAALLAGLRDRSADGEALHRSRSVG